MIPTKPRAMLPIRAALVDILKAHPEPMEMLQLRHLMIQQRPDSESNGWLNPTLIRAAMDKLQQRILTYFRSFLPNLPPVLPPGQLREQLGDPMPQLHRTAQALKGLSRQGKLKCFTEYGQKRYTLLPKRRTATTPSLFGKAN